MANKSNEQKQVDFWQRATGKPREQIQERVERAQGQRGRK